MSHVATQAPGVSVLVFTLNEEIHLPSCLAALRWCDDVVVVDSYSTDRTEAICRAAAVRFCQHSFEGFGSQRNWALESIPLRHEWVLILDADERVPAAMASELLALAGQAPAEVAAYRVRRRFHLWGRWLRHSSLYPTWVVRFLRRGRVRYVNRGHGETQEVDGAVRELTNDLLDENLKGLNEWFERQNHYSTKDAAYELEQERHPFRFAALFGSDPLARRAAMKRIAASLPARGLWYFLYSYVWRLGFLDGRDGLVFCRMKAAYQTMVSIKKHDLRRRCAVPEPVPQANILVEATGSKEQCVA